MKRFHIHVHVEDLAKNITFYSALFSQQPARCESDYAKWMLTDPPVNFAISTRGSANGIDHLGIQVETAEELTALKASAVQADMALVDDGETTCCYAKSDKYWITDPQGIAWEQFHTLDNIPVFSEHQAEPLPASTSHESMTKSCCAPKATAPVAMPAAGACCSPKAGAKSACC